MNVRDWALVAFSILAQMSVGSFLVLGVIHYFSVRKAGVEAADNLSDRALLAIGPAMILGLVASLLHLGNPMNAPRAIMNVGTSWLSREVLFGILFTGAGGLFAIMQWRKISSFAVRNVIAWVAALLGVGLVFSMSQIYMLETQPVWNSLATPISFFTTTVMLGLLAMGAAFMVNYAFLKRRDPDCAESICDIVRSTLKWIALTSIVALGVEFVVIPVYLASLANNTIATVADQMMAGEFTILLVARLALAFIGAGILGAFLYQTAQTPGKEDRLSNLAVSAFILVFSAEVLGRFLFYATHIQIRI
jgi:anaerobic dimethyl sulfoxide reductase subunit C (anchor subunit)